MNAKHTPGPWVSVGWQVEVLDDNQPDICNTNPETFGQHGRCNAERTANARLIAAAPDLLIALEYAIWAHPGLEKSKTVMDAIAKATRGSA